MKTTGYINIKTVANQTDYLNYSLYNKTIVSAVLDNLILAPSQYTMLSDLATLRIIDPNVIINDNQDLQISYIWQVK